MPSVEFLLARITAKSQGMRPKLPGGSIPYLTAEDIALGAATVTNCQAYNAIMAKYCQDEIAEARLLRHTTRYGWVLWLERNRPARTAVATQRRIAEVSVLYFLNPSSGELRGSRGCATLCGVARKTWRDNYEQHYKDLAAHLFALESEAVEHIRRVLK